MTNKELITELRGHIREVPLTLLRDAADALEAAEKRIARLEEDLKTREAEREVMQDTIKVCEKRIAELEEDIIYWQTYAAENER